MARTLHKNDVEIQNNLTENSDVLKKGLHLGKRNYKEVIQIFLIIKEALK